MNAADREAQDRADFARETIRVYQRRLARANRLEQSAKEAGRDRDQDLEEHINWLELEIQLANDYLQTLENKSDLGAHPAKNARAEVDSQKGSEMLIEEQAPNSVSHERTCEVDPTLPIAGPTYELAQAAAGGPHPIRVQTMTLEGSTYIMLSDSDGYDVHLDLDEARRVGMLLTRVSESR